jgi:hypothetical protein
LRTSNNAVAIPTPRPKCDTNHALGRRPLLETMSQEVGASVQLAVSDRFTVIEEDCQKTEISRGCCEKSTMEVRPVNLLCGEEAGASLRVSGGSLDKTPGLVVGFVTESGPEVLSFGTKMIDREQRPDGNTHFGLGAVTNVFTGFVLAKAVVDGVVSIDDSANRYLPAPLKLRDSAITLRNLVTHTSGLLNFPENQTEREWARR